MSRKKHDENSARVPLADYPLRESFAANSTLPVINGEAAYEMLGDKLPTEYVNAFRAFSIYYIYDPDDNPQGWGAQIAADGRKR